MMRLRLFTLVVAFSVGCGLFGTATEPADAPQPEPSPTNVAPVTVDPTATDPAFAAACNGNGPKDGSVEHTAVSGGPDIDIVLCEFYAYQGEYEVWLDDGDSKTRALSLVGFPTVSHMQVRNLQKYRGPGDCGMFQVWDIGEEGLTLAETRERDCDAPPLGEDDDIDPATWPLVGGNGHCGASYAFFTCAVEGGKTLSLCGASDGSTLQYRYGPLGTPELLFPEDSAPSAFRFSHDTFIRGSLTTVSFTNDGYTYSVEDQLEGGSMSGPPPVNFTGVVVRRDTEEVARLACTDDPSNNLFTLSQHLQNVQP